MTNYEKIRSMSIEEMAVFLKRNLIACNLCEYVKSCTGMDLECEQGVLKYLQQEAEK